MRSRRYLCIVRKRSIFLRTVWAVQIDDPRGIVVNRHVGKWTATELN